jgi:hypothetical protein
MQQVELRITRESRHAGEFGRAEATLKHNFLWQAPTSGINAGLGLPKTGPEDHPRGRSRSRGAARQTPGSSTVQWPRRLLDFEEQGGLRFAFAKGSDSTAVLTEVPDASFQGWYTEPYELHEARRMSQGTPTSLVRDGGIEGSDPVGGGPFTVAPVRIVRKGSHDGSDRRLSHNANSEPSPTRSGTRRWHSTRWRPVQWPAPGMEGDDDSSSTGSRRTWGFGLVVLGAFAMMGGVYLMQTRHCQPTGSCTHQRNSMS